MSSESAAAQLPPLRVALQRKLTASLRRSRASVTATNLCVIRPTGPHLRSTISKSEPRKWVVNWVEHHAVRLPAGMEPPSRSSTTNGLNSNGIWHVGPIPGHSRRYYGLPKADIGSCAMRRVPSGQTIPVDGKVWDLPAVGGDFCERQLLAQRDKGGSSVILLT